MTKGIFMVNKSKRNILVEVEKELYRIIQYLSTIQGCQLSPEPGTKIVFFRY